YTDRPSFPTRRSSDLLIAMPSRVLLTGSTLPFDAAPASAAKKMRQLAKRRIRFMTSNLVSPNRYSGNICGLVTDVARAGGKMPRSEEHTSELQSRGHL